MFAVVFVLQAIFDEFNTLSVVYQQPAALFVQRAQYQLHEDEREQEQVQIALSLHYLGFGQCLPHTAIAKLGQLSVLLRLAFTSCRTLHPCV